MLVGRRDDAKERRRYFDVRSEAQTRSAPRPRLNSDMTVSLRHRYSATSPVASKKRLFQITRAGIRRYCARINPARVPCDYCNAVSLADSEVLLRMKLAGAAVGLGARSESLSRLHFGTFPRRVQSHDSPRALQPKFRLNADRTIASLSLAVLVQAQHAAAVSWP